MGLHGAVGLHGGQAYGVMGHGVMGHGQMGLHVQMGLHDQMGLHGDLSHDQVTSGFSSDLKYLKSCTM